MAVAVLAPRSDATFARYAIDFDRFSGKGSHWNAITTSLDFGGTKTAFPCGMTSPPTGLTRAMSSPCADAGFEAVLMSAKAQGKTALCIWFHYLGGQGADWEHGLKTKLANQLPWVEWYFPDAPRKPVTCLGGSIQSCWFDHLDAHVTENMATPGLEVSVSAAHALIRQAEANGFPSNRILLGGMSQGGVLAMTAGFGYEKPFAGIIALTAWVPPCLCGVMRQPHTPLMIGNGDQSAMIPMDIVHKSANKLGQAGCSNVTKKIYPGLCHNWDDRQCQDVKDFILSTIPNSSVGCYTPHSTLEDHASGFALGQRVEYCAKSNHVWYLGKIAGRTAGQNGWLVQLHAGLLKEIPDSEASARLRTK